MNRILVIRGGAIGDFILTLPALKALRDAKQGSHIEILGYRHIAEIANNRFYANQVRSIEYGPLSGFFAKNSQLPSDLANYFSGFDLIITYLYDPDQVFENNLRRSGVEEIIRGPAKIGRAGHAARQLAEPITHIGVKVDDLAARIYPSAQDRELASEFLGNCATPMVALHPGSGSEGKNWPVEKWIELGNWLLGSRHFNGSVLVVSGEADERQMSRLESVWNNARVRFAKNLPLPVLAALFQKSVFVGHDSGISHLAAAGGAKCVLLFGPTDPGVWAPLNENVQVIRAPDGRLSDLSTREVETAITAAL